MHYALGVRVDHNFGARSTVAQDPSSELTVIPAKPVPARPLAAPKRVAPPAAPARIRARHQFVLLTFCLFVLLPTAVTAYYLWVRAQDQYASTVGFTVRTEESSSTLSLLGGITGLSGASSSDTDILFEFIQSQKLVATLQDRLDLRAIWSKPENDWYFRFEPSGSIEDLVEYWPSMVKIFYDSSTGLIEVQVRAFSAAEATAIAGALVEESSEMINALSAIAREDTIRYARQELEGAVERLKSAREEVTRFRNSNQLVDPTVDLQAQAGLLGNLQSSLAEALIEIDLLQDTTRAGDPRLIQAQRRVEVIEARIAAERRKLGLGGSEGEEQDALATIVGEYERLAVEREFAESAYVTTLASYDAALAEARRQSRYLGAYVAPTLAETSRYPERMLLLTLVSLFLFLGWAIGVLIWYALKDRR